MSARVHDWYKKNATFNILLLFQLMKSADAVMQPFPDISSGISDSPWTVNVSTADRFVFYTTRNVAV